MGLRRFSLEVRQPFRLDLTVSALRRRPHNVVDRFDGTRYSRTAVLDGRVLELVVCQSDGSAGPRLDVELESAGRPPGSTCEAAATGFLRRVLSIDADLGGFYRWAEGDERLMALAARHLGMRPPRFPSVFEALVNAICCQQLSLTVGIHLVNRLTGRFSRAGLGSGLPAPFPSPGELGRADLSELCGIGLSRAKATAIGSLAKRVASTEIDLEALDELADDEVRATLISLPGIGRWSAEYAMLRGLGRLNVLPGDDVGARNSLVRRFGLDPSAGYDEVSKLGRSWWPYGGLVYFHLLLDGLAEAGH